MSGGVSLAGTLIGLWFAALTIAWFFPPFYFVLAIFAGVGLGLLVLVMIAARIEDDEMDWE